MFFDISLARQGSRRMEVVTGFGRTSFEAAGFPAHTIGVIGPFFSASSGVGGPVAKTCWAGGPSLDLQVANICYVSNLLAGNFKSLHI